MPDPHIHFHDIPNWVWGCLIVALFFFGVLFMIPEARQGVGEYFTHSQPTQQNKSNLPFRDDMPPGMFQTEEQARNYCGPGNYYGTTNGFDEPGTAHPRGAISYGCLGSPK
jgi:hypothetical protein